MAKIGLLLNTVGAIILVMTSGKETTLLIEVLSQMKDTYGKFDSNREEVIPTIEKLLKTKKRNNIWNKIAWWLFIIGFILQLIQTSSPQQ